MSLSTAGLDNNQQPRGGCPQRYIYLAGNQKIIDRAPNIQRYTGIFLSV